MCEDSVAKIMSVFRRCPLREISPNIYKLVSSLLVNYCFFFEFTKFKKNLTRFIIIFASIFFFFFIYKIILKINSISDFQTSIGYWFYFVHLIRCGASHEQLSIVNFWYKSFQLCERSERRSYTKNVNKVFINLILVRSLMARKFRESY